MEEAELTRLNITMQVFVMEQTKIETAAVTDVGLVRTLNEDSIAVVSKDQSGKAKKGAVLVLADGLGGHNAGEAASKLVTSSLPELYIEASGMDCASSLFRAVTACNKMVHEESLTSPVLQGMGTTVVAVVVVNQYAIFVNVGDSRGYLFRDGSIIHRTKDHSLKDASVDVPGVSPTNRFSHVLTRAIGPKPNVLIDITTHRIAKGDVILLCSDGLSDYVSDEEMKEMVSSYPCADAVEVLVDLAKERGGEDNISAIVANLQEVCIADSANPHLSGVHRYLVS
ncbi:MAG: Stp1/IreP family PP2C-type Ser/Thr phosphatase [Bacteroidetes bacterium]|nr:Stp1/IreP family PP2C-type Ser/Thr phosphatase [Bacteroidota bacterium]